LTLVIAHRGASAYEVENSLAAFRLAVDQGADGIELDIHATADGGLIVHHDDHIGSTSIPTSFLSAVRDLRLANNERVPILSDVMEAVQSRVQLFIEVKTLPPRWDDRLAALLQEGPAPDRYHVHGFDHRIVRRFTTRKPPWPGGVLSASYPIDPVAPIRAAGAAALWQANNQTDADLVDLVHQAGATIYVWTVDDADRMRQLKDWGVDGICTNRPDVARSVIT
jgi:glycerophosphoryl diester phosphodiesterase